MLVYSVFRQASLLECCHFFLSGSADNTGRTVEEGEEAEEEAPEEEEETSKSNDIPSDDEVRGRGVMSAGLVQINYYLFYLFM